MTAKDYKIFGGLPGRVANWCEGSMSLYTRGVFVAIIIGLLCGLSAFVLKWMIATVSRWLMTGVPATGVDWRLLFLPLCGIVLVGLFQRYVLHRNIEHGIERVQDYLKRQNYDLGFGMVYSPMAASVLTLGFGGSAGSEGPIATVGAAIGSWVAKRLGMSPEMMRILIGCGAGAGIAGIFKAPMGGMLFTLEVLQLQLTTLSVMTLIVACVTSAMTAYLCSGCIYDINVVRPEALNPSTLPLVIVFGIVCGLYSLYYSGVMSAMRKRYDAMNNPLLRNILAGGLLAVLVFLFPTLYGEGYGSLTKLLDGENYILTGSSLFFNAGVETWVLIVVAGGILIAKPFAASATTSGGGVAGDFAPTLFAGAIIGYFFALTANTLFGLELSIPAFAFVGMGALMSGAIRAPLMAIFLVSEMVDGYQFFLPLLMASMVSYLLVKVVKRWKQSRG